MNYHEFASTISFFEFNQNEFHNPVFNVKDYIEEINNLKTTLTIESLTKIFESLPKTVDIFEQIFQLKRFTNTHYIHFCFDVNILNNDDEENIRSYCEKSVLSFENGVGNNLFNRIYKQNKPDNVQTISLFGIKKSIPIYVETCIKKREYLYMHLTNSISSRLRLSRYLIENLKADEYLNALNIENYLKLKRIPKDTKGLHGKFGASKISSRLRSLGINDVTNLVVSQVLPLNKSVLSDKDSIGYSFVREKSVESIVKRKDNKLKKFDFIILKNGLPLILIETNFYTTSGTKIGINVGEYADLNEDIDRKTNGALLFSWVTDGNFWLTKEGEELFNNLKNNYFKLDHNLLNYNLMLKYLKKKIIKDE